MRTFGATFCVSHGEVKVAPLDALTNKPVADIFVVNPEIGRTLKAYPEPYDLSLVIEVSGATLSFDLSTKAALYARAGIVEYWVMDVTGRTLTIHRHPDRWGGRYLDVALYAESETAAPLANPDTPLSISALLLPLPA